MALREHQRQCRPTAGRSDLDPTLTIPERDIRDQRKAQSLGVKAIRLILIRHRDRHGLTIWHHAGGLSTDTSLEGLRIYALPAFMRAG